MRIILDGWALLRRPTSKIDSHKDQYYRIKEMLWARAREAAKPRPRPTTNSLYDNIVG